MSASPSPRPAHWDHPPARRRAAAPAPLPRGGVDPIDSAEVALALLRAVRQLPPAAETIAFLLDDARRGQGAIVVVSDTRAPDDVVDVVEMVGRAAADRVASGAVSGLVVASCRPVDGLLDGDAGRWCLLSDLAEWHGLTLVEWLVLGVDGPRCPRELCGEPPRWHTW